MKSDYPAWRGRIAKANNPDFWPIEAIDALLAGGQAQWWCDGRGGMVTRVVAYPGGAAVLEVLAGAGDLRALIDNIAPQAEAWAKANGLTHLMTAGRHGWQRVLKGWRHHQTIIVKELT